MEFIELTEKIAQEIRKPLPGKAVQLIMSSIQRLRELFDFHDEKKAIKSSVLILLYPDQGTTMFVVTQRFTYDGIHSGQISLPGGRYETTDKDLAWTALREANEEIGVDPGKIRILGQLTELYIPPSNYLVYPFVGIISEKPEFAAHPKEVKEIIEIPLPELLNPDNRRKRNILVRGMEILAPCYIIRDVTIWGATAMILSEFRELVKRTTYQEEQPNA